MGCPTDYNLEEDDVIILFCERAISGVIREARRAIREANKYDKWENLKNDFGLTI